MKNINEAKEHLRRENNIPVITRMASNTIVKQIQTVFGPELFVMEKQMVMVVVLMAMWKFFIEN